VVLAATFELAQGDRSRSEAEITEIVRWRREHQPGGHNAGSVFVNPVPGLVAAAQLVDDLGLRGYRRGTAHVSEKHANFIQADEGGSADDVRAVIDHVRSCVDAHHGIMLRSEIRMVGFEEVTGRG
jgi:UDP-N-acetylmuramate dehydrogenase